VPQPLEPLAISCGHLHVRVQAESLDIGTAGLLLSNGLLVVSIIRPECRFWPPPEKSSRQYKFTRAISLLAPLTLLGVVALGPLDSGSGLFGHPARFVLGPLLFSIGCGFALWGYLGLGVSASQGHHESLIAAGAYRYSRNPQYVGTIVGLLGYAVLFDSALELVVWALWSVWFLMAPFAEEPWLREQVGPSYDEYAKEVPRYFRCIRRDADVRSS
jgi:protein-S-isoprenylcysteine O-methyltransferase Ste14